MRQMRKTYYIMPLSKQHKTSIGSMVKQGSQLGLISFYVTLSMPIIIRTVDLINFRKKLLTIISRNHLNIISQTN